MTCLRRSWRRSLIAVAIRASLPLLLSASGAAAQQLDLMHGGPIDITASDGIEWRQADQQVIARGDARAVRGNVTVTADRLTAWYRKKKATTATATTATTKPAAAPGTDPTTEDNEIYRLQADGNVHIFTQTDRARGDKAVYDLDQAVLVMTGHDLKLTTPNEVITARDDLEYWPQKHMAVARGDAVVVTSDARRIAADTLVAYTTDNPPPAGQPGSKPAPKPAATPASGNVGSADQLAASGTLQRVEAFGHVSIRTQTDTVTGDRGVYVADTGMARIAGQVRINRGQNQLNGAEADVNMKTGIATLVAAHGGRVHGLVVPNDATNKGLADGPAAPSAPSPSAQTPGAASSTPGLRHGRPQ